MSSSLQRSRSLRKPTIPPPAEKAAKLTGTDVSRNASPSRLPVKPSTRPTSLLIPSSSASNNTTATSRSGGAASSSLTRSTSLSKKQHGVSVQDATKKETSRYPPLSSANRPPGAIKPRPTSAGSGSVPPTRRGSTHVRAKSTVTGLTAATSLRPPSREQNAASGAATTVSRLGHGRHTSMDKGPSTPAKQSAGPATAVKAPGQLRLRPAFSTLQQHYSPAKSQAPKPLTSTILAPPSPSKLPANIAASASTNKLQAELLQLHLIHRDSHAVQLEWQVSAKVKLGSRFERLSQDSRVVSGKERAAVESDNILALRRWARSGKCGIEEKIQSLDEIFMGLWGLSEPAGRYARIVRRFERWVNDVCDAEEARHDVEKMLIHGQNSLFIGELDATWKEECASLARRLEAWRAQLAEIDDLGQMQQNTASGDASSLERMLSGARFLVQDMLTELQVMEEIEQQALAREDEWIAQVNQEGDEDVDTPKAGAVWRLM